MQPSIVKTNVAKDQTALTQNFNNLASLGDPSQWVGGTAANQQLQDQQTIPKVAALSASQGVIPALFGKLSSVAKTVANIGEDVGKTVVKEALSVPRDAWNAVSGLNGLMTAGNNQKALNIEIDGLNQQTQNLSKSFQSGRISLKQYNDGMRAILNAHNNITESLHQNESQITQSASKAKGGVVNTTANVIAVMTAGAAAPLTAAIKDKGTSAAVDLLMNGRVGKVLESVAPRIDSLTSLVSKGTSRLTGTSNSFSLQTMGEITSEVGAKNGATLGSSQIAKNVAVNLLLKKPLIYQSTISSATDAYKELLDKKYGSAVGNMALLGSMALEGGPIGFALKQFSKGSDWLKSAAFSGGDPKALANELLTSQTKSVSRQSFIDALSAQTGDQNPAGIYNELMQRLSTGDTKSYQMMKVMEDTNMKMAGGNSVAAANQVADFLNSLDGGEAVKDMSHAQLIDNMINWAETRQSMVEAAKDGRIDGVSPMDAERIVLGRAGVSDINFIQQFMKQADDKALSGTLIDRAQARQTMLNELVGKYGTTAAWANSDSFLRQIKNIISTKKDTTEMVTALNSINLGEELDGVPNDLRNSAREKGFIAILPKNTHTPYTTFEDTNKNIRTSFANQTSDEAAGKGMFTQAVKPIPTLQSVGSFLSRLGLSPESSEGAVQTMFKQNLQDTLPSDIVHIQGETAEQSVDTLMKKLADYTKNPTTGILRKAPITDYRQMTNNDIQAALNVGKSDAKTIMKALNTAMLKVPLQVRGLGDRVMDLNYAVNPLAGGYARIQGAARFAYNPFFRWQQTTQTEFLAQMESGGKGVAYPAWNKVNSLLFPGKTEELNNTVKLLEQKGIFGSGFSGTLADNQAVGNGLIGTKLLKSEKISLAGLTNVMAERVGMPVDKFVEQYHNETLDALRTIVQYPTKGGFLNSPLARTINLAFFPFRYNMKIAGLMAKQLSTLGAPMQVALIKNLFQMSSFLKSDEGIAWASKNSDAIQLFQWLSPLYPLSYVQKILTDVRHPDEASIGDFGLLGGLPFGFISQMLNSNQIINLNLPYVDPKSGNVFPDYIPNSAKAEANLAIQDLLGQTFSYPGATAGLPSKGSILRSVAGGIVPGSKNDFTKKDVSNQLTSDQKHTQQVIQSNKPITGANGQPINTWEGASIPTQITFSHSLPAPKQSMQTLSPSQLLEAKNNAASTKKKESQFVPRPIQVR